MMASDQLIVALNNLIDHLNAPVSLEEQQEGWTPQAKTGILKYFQNRKTLMQGQFEGTVPGLIRGLDAWGVSHGLLYDEAMNIDRLLR